MCKIFHSTSFLRLYEVQQIKPCNSNREGERKLTERPFPCALSGFVLGFFFFLKFCSGFILLDSFCLQIKFFQMISCAPQDKKAHSQQTSRY